MTSAGPERLVAETPDTIGAYPRLTPAQLETLSRVGTTVPVSGDEVLVRAGESPVSFFVVLEGRLAVYEGEHVEIHGPGRFVGDIGLLEGQPTFTTIAAVERGMALEVPIEELEAIVTGDPLLGDVILRAYLIRRSMAIGFGAGLRVIGSPFSPETRQLLDFAARNRIPHRLLDVERDPGAESILRRMGLGVSDVPVVIVAGSRILRNPSVVEVARALGMRSTRPPTTSDVLVVGAGPAGLAATVYAASDGLSVVLADAVATGGQAALSARIENYLGFPSGISGAELAERATLQVSKFGATLFAPSTAQSLAAAAEGSLVVGFSDGTSASPRTVVIACGMTYNRLDVANLDRFEYTSVYHAATINEARECGGEPVVVVGGGNSAGQAAVFLGGTASHVHLVVRGADLSASMSRYLTVQVENHSRISVHLQTVLVDANGDGHLESVIVEHMPSGERREIATSHLFVFVGATPSTSWLGPDFERDDRGYLITGGRTTPAGSTRRSLETSMPGVFAVGDARSGSVKRISAAIGEGASVVRMVHDHLATGGSRG
ncbi:FAD-dependent oxidoreductase [Herbiconiux daphne]|uniref:FAD-dependent oxidoreductase n=1 Tax=Herbiconiux daphne TaxID=2970914 RepID=A0ABT2GX30_9MICO|nr:FAD-dependent oxidoreductase [Herbiconiux daphne]MCS5732510.1 FAD-dependent oxidoreductase [Herbiconiux daphne]